MKDLLKALQDNALEILDNEQLKNIKGGEVYEDVEEMLEVE